MKLVAVCLVLGVVLLAGCRITTVRSEVDVEIINRSSHDLENAKVMFGENACEWGWVVRSATKGYGFYPHPITARAELHWDQTGGHRNQLLDLVNIYPQGKSGRLTFTVYDNRIEANFRPAP